MLSLLTLTQVRFVASNFIVTFSDGLPQSSSNHVSTQVLPAQTTQQAETTRILSEIEALRERMRNVPVSRDSELVRKDIQDWKSQIEVLESCLPESELADYKAKREQYLTRLRQNVKSGMQYQKQIEQEKKRRRDEKKRIRALQLQQILESFSKGTFAV